MHERIEYLERELETYKEALREQSMKVAKLSSEKKQILDSAVEHITRGDSAMKKLEAAIEDVKAMAIVIVDQEFKDHPKKNEVTARNF